MNDLSSSQAQHSDMSTVCDAETRHAEKRERRIGRPTDEAEAEAEGDVTDSKVCCASQMLFKKTLKLKSKGFAPVLNLVLGGPL